MNLEPVYAVWEFWDGIRSGFADFNGVPHYFESTWDELAQEHSPVLSLKAIDHETLDLVREQARMFSEWQLAFHRGEAKTEHPALPGQNARFVEIDRIVGERLACITTVTSARATFVTLPGQEDLPKGVMREVAVRWRLP